MQKLRPQNDQFIYEKLYAILGEIVFIVQILLSLFVLIFILYTISQNIREQTTQYGPMLLKMGMVVLALSTYHFWTVEIADLIVAIARYVGDEQGFTTVYKGLVKAFINHWNSTEFSWSWKTLWDIGSLAVNLIHSILSSIVLFLCLLAIACGEAGFTLGQFFMQALLWVFGPISIAISLVPMYADAFKHWLKNFIAVNFWSVMYAALTRFFYHTVTEEVQELLSPSIKLGLPHYIQICAYSLTFFLMICLIPYITDYIIPSPTGQELASSLQDRITGLHRLAMKPLPGALKFAGQLIGLGWNVVRLLGRKI